MTRTAPTEPRTAGTGIAEGLVLLAGLYLIVAPWLTGGFDGLLQLVANDLVVGLALVLLAVTHALAFDRMRGLSWVIPVLGLWVVVAPLVIYHPGQQRPGATAWTHNSIGGGIALVAGILVAASALRRTRGRTTR